MPYNVLGVFKHFLNGCSSACAVRLCHTQAWKQHCDGVQSCSMSTGGSLALHPTRTTSGTQPSVHHSVLSRMLSVGDHTAVTFETGLPTQQRALRTLHMHSQQQPHRVTTYPPKDTCITTDTPGAYCQQKCDEHFYTGFLLLEDQRLGVQRPRCA